MLVHFKWFPYLVTLLMVFVLLTVGAGRVNRAAATLCQADDGHVPLWQVLKSCDLTHLWLYPHLMLRFHMAVIRLGSLSPQNLHVHSANHRTPGNSTREQM